MNKIFTFFCLLFLISFVFYFLKDAKHVVMDTLDYARYSKSALKLNYEEKMEMSFGITYKFARFIIQNTPSDAKILIPPQGYPWAMTGNVLFFRYFLYPRQLINGDEMSAKVDLTKDVDYVLVDWGEYNQSEYGYTNGWPKFGVDATQIILIEDFDGKSPSLKTFDMNFDPNEDIYKNKWGLIKVKKT